MKIKLVSDLHLDIQADNGIGLLRDIPANDHDLLVIAGDLCEAQNIDFYYECWETISLKFKKVLYTTGNHEYWGMNPWVADKLIDDVLTEFSNVARIKVGESHIIDGHRFVGGTMWFPDTGDVESQEVFADFMMIPNFRSYVFEENRKFIDMFNNGKAQKGDIVITHHIPSYQLINKMYQNNPDNQFFACEMVEYMKKVKPYAWLYGHTHKQNNTLLENTWCVCNPFGYPRESSTLFFNEKLVLDIVKL